MKDIKESVKILFSTEEHRKIVNKFARAAYDEKFKNKKSQEGAYHAYDTFEILSENKIRVKYTYGGGDMDFNDSFNIEI
jgi:hypothetical protein